MEEPKPFSESRKRPLEHVAAHTQNSPQYKMRAVLRDLRPHFVEVLKTPDFQNCKAASDIREGMKLLMDLYKDMAEQSTKLEKCSNSDIDNGQKPAERQEDVKPAANHPQNGVSTKPSDTHVEGTYIVGGSAFGWNFITFNSAKALYYGRTKEAFRAANPKSE
ncbi:hypothetical protein Salat_2276600 [Sesamum alatum]|uniref:Uncharacterized protein n=1 Tax=Sesamum alatum TaxID=300844 RepID=A0AAE2CDZ9_9LAMI|nr:hypothetical protein Salat_2276600 [Sesamum alatum]